MLYLQSYKCREKNNSKVSAVLNKLFTHVINCQIVLIIKTRLNMYVSMKKAVHRIIMNYLQKKNKKKTKRGDSG
uniref:Transposase n=1 Tax=Strongyloides venezuelensis TaxID=75913 RepID=A0A0K0EXZ6_STRVS